MSFVRNRRSRGAPQAAHPAKTHVRFVQLFFLRMKGAYP
nr:MAG TPA: hypothetical protein [Caudoviricetes sp.]